MFWNLCLFFFFEIFDVQFHCADNIPRDLFHKKIHFFFLQLFLFKVRGGGGEGGRGKKNHPKKKVRRPRIKEGYGDTGIRGGRIKNTHKIHKNRGRKFPPTYSYSLIGAPDDPILRSCCALSA